jgi:hypothetical protein
MKFKYQLILSIGSLTVWSCKSALHTIKTTNDLELSIHYVVDFINNCVEGTNQINVDEKATFDINNKLLTIYKGESIGDYYQKWEIPLSDLDPSSLELDDSELGGNRVTVFTKDSQGKIKYYKEGSYVSNTEQINYYLGFCWKKSKEKEYFIESFRQAIILSKKNN